MGKDGMYVLRLVIIISITIHMAPTMKIDDKGDLAGMYYNRIIKWSGGEMQGFWQVQTRVEEKKKQTARATYHNKARHHRHAMQGELGNV